MSKHQEILDYLAQLEVGKRISVRGIANRLSVSEGTAYRAIKEAENRGLVETHHRSGTVRIDNQPKFFPGQLRFADLVQITGAEVVSGQAGLKGQFNQFLIGAMTAHSMKKYLKPNGLVIVGDREEIQALALESGNALLVTGGFSISQKMKALSNEMSLPILVSSHDTFTLASLINQAFIKLRQTIKDCQVAAIYQSKEDYGYLTETNQILDYLCLKERTSRVRFPLVNQAGRLVGVVSLRDVVGYDPERPLREVMSQQPISVQPETSLASVGQLMVAEDFDLLPVVNQEQGLLGVVTRRQVMNSLDWANPVSPLNQKVLDLSWQKEVEGFSYPLDQALFGLDGVLSQEWLLLALSQLHEKILEQAGKKHIIIEQMMIYWLEEVKEGVRLLIKPQLSLALRHNLVDFTVFVDDKPVAKAMMTSKVD